MPSTRPWMRCPPPWGMRPSFFEVHVDHLPWRGIFIPAGAVPTTDPDPCGRVREPQRRAEVAGQDSVDRGEVQVQVIRDPGRTPAPVHPQPQHAPLGAHPGPVRACQGPASAVLQAGLTQLPIAAGPTCRRRHRDIEALGSPAQRPAINHDVPGQLQTTQRSSCSQHKPGDLDPTRPCCLSCSSKKGPCLEPDAAAVRDYQGQAS